MGHADVRSPVIRLPVSRGLSRVYRKRPDMVQPRTTGFETESGHRGRTARREPDPNDRWHRRSFDSTARTNAFRNTTAGTVFGDAGRPSNPRCRESRKSDVLGCESIRLQNGSNRGNAELLAAAR